jgi:MGT family glycosyltransferase
METDVFDDNPLGWTRFISGTRLAEDVASELGREPADVVVFDAFRSAALAAAEQARVPAAALVHVLYQPCVEGDSATTWDPTRPLLDETRRRLGLAPLDPAVPVISALWDHARLVLGCVPEAFDFPLASRPAKLRYVGPIFEPATSHSRPGQRPLVVVSFSSTNMRQGPVLQRVLDALAPLEVEVLCTLGSVPVGELRPPANATVRDFVPHMSVLPAAALVVTHAGLSTVMAALANGVPLVCMPMGRDQPLNAERVAALGLGCVLSSEAPESAIRTAVEEVLGRRGFRDEARAFAGLIAGCGNGSRAALELEALL